MTGFRPQPMFEYQIMINGECVTVIECSSD